LATLPAPGPAPRRTSILSLLLAVGAFLVAGSGAAAQSGALAGLDAYVERAMAEWEVPGLALAVVQGDSVLYARGYGVTRLGGEEGVDQHTLFAIASTTKAMTAAALGILVEEEKVGWHDPVARHLPWFQVADPYVSRELTVRDLLTHRVGAARLDNLWIASPFSRDEILRRARHLPQVESFRQTYGYNNILYIAAGEVVAAAAGTSWDSFLEDRLFGPLGMERSTSRSAVVEERGNVAHSHTPIEGVVQAVPRRDYDAIGGAGAAWSSAHDMARWVQLHLGEGTFRGERILAPETLEAMYESHTVISGDSVTARLHPSNHFRGYALGWRVEDLHGRKVVQHSGSINYTRTQVSMVPAEEIGVVVMANLSSSNLQLALSHWVLDALQGREPPDWSALYLEVATRSREQSEVREAELQAARIQGAGPTLPLEGYAGSYDDPLFGPVRIVVEAGSTEGGENATGLVLRYSPEYIADLEHWHQDIFRATWRRPGAGGTFLRFVLDPRGRITTAGLDGFADFRRTGDP